MSSGSSSGKYEPVDQTPASKKLSLSKFSLIASLTSIVFVIIILCLIMGWFWGVPSFIGKKSRVSMMSDGGYFQFATTT